MLLIGTGWALLAAFDLWLILVVPDAAWDKKVSFVLALIGIYTFAFGVIEGSGILAWWPRLGRDLTGPHPVLLLGAIVTLLGMLFSAAALAIDSKKTSESFDRRGGLYLSFLQMPVIFLVMIILIPFALVYILFVVPLAWIAYAIVSAPLDSLLTSARDQEWTVEDRSITIKQLVDEHLVTLRNALVAVPALVSSVVLGASSLL
jgi:hypothetical protein